MCTKQIPADSDGMASQFVLNSALHHTYTNVKCVKKKNEILVKQQPPQGVFVFDHAGLVIYQSPHPHRSSLKQAATIVRKGEDGMPTFEMPESLGQFAPGAISPR